MPDVYTELFERVGTALWGDDWRMQMSRELDINIRTVQRWASGARPIPAGVWVDLATLADKRRVDLGVLIPSIHAAASAVDGV